MAFDKKARIVTKDVRPQSNPRKQREALVVTLKTENTVESRKALKKMNDKVYRGARSNLKEWFKPTGKGCTAKP
ncbi:hypothetical protein D3C71_479990 [compost metagenome]